MEFRRNAARDDRRRRAILDDRNGAGRSADAAGGEEAAGGKRGRRYSAQALLERRVRVVDLIPIHWTSVAAYYLLGVVLIGLLATLHYYAAAKLTFANLTSVNSLGGWLAIIAFWTAAQGALVIYRIRRHRIDDYRGRYHVWLWSVALLGLAGIDLLVDFRTPLGQWIEATSGRQFADLENGWALLVASVFYGLAMLRIVWEVRASRGALAVALLSITALGTFVASKANLILWPEQLDPQLATCVLYLSGVCMLSMMLTQYARFVWMDAIGLIVPKAVAETEEQAEEEKKPAKSARRRPTIVKKEAEAAAEEASDEDADSGWFSWGRKKAKPAAAEEEAETEQAPAARRAAKPAVKTAAKASEEEESPAAEKRGWFGFGRKKEAAEEASEAAPKAAAKPAPAKQPAAKKEAEKVDDEAPKRGWFGFGGKSKSEEEPVEEKKPASPLAASARRAVVKQQQAETSAPPETLKMEPLTLGGGANSAEDDEIAALEAKPDHMLTKAERRRLKKLKRRGVAA
ncbi:hypothetical protein [Blastopirellula marina]|uniref:Uncharacterized protein n=1 Tax=Blastopirellula marina TaxID=124 RepID=A0A2S8GIG7_9BACT|nr:hypothetical protein [Blastopirellula marina]PQO44121.1 hypothetical protein C5Y93_21535 [Blastopirellula marina]